MRVGARKGFAYHSVKLVLLANGNKDEVVCNTCFLRGKELYPLLLPFPNSDLLFDKHSYLSSVSLTPPQHLLTYFCTSHHSEQIHEMAVIKDDEIA